MEMQPVFIISGKQGGGKTTTLTRVVNFLKKKDFNIYGFVAPGEWEDGKRTKFFIRDIQSESQKILCQNSDAEGFEKYGRFYFDPETIFFGEQLVSKSRTGDLIVLDEIGRFELNGHVWSQLLKKLIKKSENPLLITVRGEFLTSVIQEFEIKKQIIFQTNEDALLISDKIESILRC
jgi:nucleoside-triphosphatase